MTTEDDSRELGVELGQLDEDLESHEYPATATELSEAYGDRTVELPDGERSFGNLLEPLVEEQDAEETFDDADEVRHTLLNLVPSDAVGRERYSDRGDDPDESNESF